MIFLESALAGDGGVQVYGWVGGTWDDIGRVGDVSFVIGSLCSFPFSIELAECLTCVGRLNGDLATETCCCVLAKPAGRG